MPKVKRIRQGYECLNIYSPAHAGRGELYTESGTIHVKAGEGYTFSFWHRMLAADSNCVLFRILDSQDREVVSWETDNVAGSYMGGRCGGDAGAYVQARHTDWSNQPAGNHIATAYFPDETLECVTNVNNPVIKHLATGGLALNEWNHWVFTWDGVMGDIRNSTKLFVNGKQYAANESETGHGNGVNHKNFDITGGRLLLFGDRISIGTSYFDIDNHNVYDCAFWNTGLTAKQVRKLYNRTTSPLNMETNSATGYWRMRSQYFTKRNYPWSKGPSGMVIFHRIKALAGPDLVNTSNQGSITPASSTTHDMDTDETMPFEWDEDHYSGITSGTPKTTTIAIDGMSGHYPTISRTGDSTRRGNYNVKFDDRNTIVFSEGASEVTYPQLLKSDTKTLHPLLKKSGVITPHNTLGSITTTANVNPNVVSNYALKGDRILISDRTNEDLIANGEAVAGSTNVTPFIDSRINLGTSDFYLTGTSEEIHPGFSSRLHDKTQIVIDLTPKEDTFLYRLGQIESTLDPSGEFANNPSTGFLYYDHSNKQWQNTGNFNDSTGIQGPAIQNFRAGTTRQGYSFYTGSDRIACQFIASPHDGAVGGKILRDRYNLSGAFSTKIAYNQLGYTSIGKATNFFLAPSSTRYHATSSQTLDMSQYINQPFLLEKAVLEVPFVYRRKVSGSYNLVDASSRATRLKNITGSNTRDIDNFVFFAYRQTDPRINNDSLETHKSKKTQRDLIFSSSLSFFNSESMYFLDNASDRVPLHTPSVSVDVDLDVVHDGTTETRFEKVITGTYYLEIVPAVQQRGLLGMTNYVGVSNETGSFYLPDMASPVNTIDPFYSVQPIQHFYEGGVRNSRFFPADHTGSLVGGNDSNPSSGTPLFFEDAFTFTTLTNAFRKSSLTRYEDYKTNVTLNKSNLNFSTRNIVSQFGKDADLAKTKGFIQGDLVGGVGPYLTSIGGVKLPVVEAASSDVSPYLLLPSDRLVFGWDAGISYDTDIINANKVSGSNMHNFPDTNFDRGQITDRDPVVRQSLFDRSNFCKITGSFGKILASKPTKLTLYGSQVSQKREFHDTLNQNLTTLAVHEAIHYDNPVIDQFVVGTETEYSGSYLDYHVTGSVGSIAKSVIGSGENVLSGSFQRFRAFDNRQQRFYDTVLPSVEKMYKVDGFETVSAKIILPGYNVDGLRFGGIGSGTVGGTAPLYRHAHWSYIFPFESRYSKCNRRIKQNVFAFTVNAYGDRNTSSNSVFGASFLGEPDFGGTSGFINRDDYFKQGNSFFFGFGANAISDSSSSFRLNRKISLNGRFDRPIGCKYGVLNFKPQFTKNIFRGDKFGQRADMLEQAQDSRFLVGSNFTTEGPIRIRFVADDDDDDQYVILDEDEITSNTAESSNLSIYATSSLPFFDDDTPKNRPFSKALFANRVIDIIGFNN